MTNNDLLTYSGNVHRGIAAALINDKLGAHAYPGIQAPHTLTYPFRLHQPTVANVNRALKLNRAVEANINLSPVRITTESGLILVEVPSPVPVVIQARQLQGDGLIIPVGMSSRRAIVGVDFEADSHLLIVGATNKGKTVSSRNIAYQLLRQHEPDQIQMIVSCFKRKNWEAFSPFARIITSPAETLEMLMQLRSLMYKRAECGIESPRIFVFLDDCLNLFAYPGVDDVMSELLPLARGCGINFVLISQRLVGMSKAVTGNCSARILFNVADTQDSGIVGGRSDLGAETLGRYPGDCLIIANDGITRTASALVTNEEVEQFAIVKQWTCKPLHDAFAIVNSGFAIENLQSGEGVSKYAQNKQNTPTFANSDSRLQTSDLRLQTRLQGKPKTDLEREFVRESYVECDGSMNATMKKVWGSVGSNYAAYIRECVEEK